VGAPALVLGVSAVAMASLVAPTVAMAAQPAAHAVTVTQTSPLLGLAPGVAPVPITALVTNTSSETVQITAVVVEITSVTLASDAAPGTCGPSDYVVSGARMAVGRTLDAGQSVAVNGASIGFRSTGVNQDACQRAVVQLAYTAQSGAGPGPDAGSPGADPSSPALPNQGLPDQGLPNQAALPNTGGGLSLPLGLAVALALLGAGGVAGVWSARRSKEITVEPPLLHRV
jgi:hypothetical protein